MAFTDNFNRANSGIVGNGWTEEVDALWQIFTNKCRGTTNGSTQYWAKQLKRPSGEAFADGTITVDFQFVTSLTGVPQIHGRCQGANDDSFYLIYWTGNTLYLAKLVSGAYTTLNTAATGALSVGTNYRLTLTMSGTGISGQLEDLDAVTVKGTVSAADSALTAAGKQAISSGASGNPIDYDNFSASPAAQTITVPDAGAGADAILVDTGAITVVISDTGLGSDAVAQITASLTETDTGSGVETLDGSFLQLKLLERFGGTLSAWTLDTAGGTASIQTIDNDEKLRLNDTSASGVVSAIRGFTEPTETYLVEADMMTPSGAAGYLEILDSLDNVLFSVKVNGNTGQGTFDTDSDTPTSFTWTAATYKMAVLKVDPIAKTVACFYTTGDGTIPSDWSQVGTAKSYSGATAAKIRFITDVTDTGIFWVDEVKIYVADIFSIGDSNTAGHAVTIASWNPNPEDAGRKSAIEDETHSWPYKLGQKYSPAKWIANRGIDAAKSADTDAQVQGDVIDQGAQACVVLIGTNDITASVPLATIQTNISSVITKLKNAGVVGTLCSVPPSNGWSAAQNTTRDSLNSWLQTQASSNGFGFADFYTAVKDTVNPDIILPAYDAGDGLHFTAAGLQAIADTVYAAMPTRGAVPEAGVGADGVSISVMMSIGDIGGGVDSPLGSVVLTETDAATGIDSVLKTVFIGAVVGDAGGGADSVSKVVTGGATLQDVYDLVLTRLGSADYTAPDNAALEFIGKWVGNKLVVTDKAINLYDDDDTTLLKTWSWDSIKRTRGRAL